MLFIENCFIAPGGRLKNNQFNKSSHKNMIFNDKSYVSLIKVCSYTYGITLATGLQ